MPELANPQWERYCQERAAGRVQYDAYLTAGLARKGQDNPRSVVVAASKLERSQSDVKRRIMELRGAMTQAALRDATPRRSGHSRAKVFADLPGAVGIAALDKAALLIELQGLDRDVSGADLAELYTPDGKFRPLQEWPDVWRKLLVIGIEVDTKKVRSHDGEDRDGAGGWDLGDGAVVKVKFANRAQILLAIKELRGRHNDVGAFTEAKGDMNITFVQQQVNMRLEEGRKRVLALDRARVEEAVVVAPATEGVI